MSKAAALCDVLARGGIVRVAGVHDGLSALIASRCGFDALWASGLGVSAVHAVPDASILTMTEFRDASAVIDGASPLPVISDCDTGFGEVRHLRRAVTEFERAGIAAICIEDKAYPKRNSFRAGHELADPHEFAMKVRAAKAAQREDHFMVIARVESLIAGAGIEDALMRSVLYSEAGADAILIHSKSSTGDELIEFARRWREHGAPTPLVAVPTTYPGLSARELEASGILVVIYANQALRAAISATERTLRHIVEAGSSAEIEGELAEVGAVFDLTGEAEIDSYDNWYATAVDKARAAARR